jgi:hypothetical protein
LVFPPLLEAVGSRVTFGIFALINPGSTIFAIKLAPETRGRTLDELEDDFRTHDAAHFVHASPANVRLLTRERARAFCSASVHITGGTPPWTSQPAAACDSRGREQQAPKRLAIQSEGTQ